MLFHPGSGGFAQYFLPVIVHFGSRVHGAVGMTAATHTGCADQGHVAGVVNVIQTMAIEGDTAPWQQRSTQGTHQMRVEMPPCRQRFATANALPAHRLGITPGSTLQQQHPGTGLHQFVRRHCATKTTADDDEIVMLNAHDQWFSSVKYSTRTLRCAVW